MIKKLDELFGSPDQVALMRRAEHLWALLQSNPDYSYYGRMVSLCNPGKDAFEKIQALAKIQGATSCQYCPTEEADKFCSELSAAGITPSRYEQCRGEDDTYSASQQMLKTTVMPEDLTFAIVDENTPSYQVADMILPTCLYLAESCRYPALRCAGET